MATSPQALGSESIASEDSFDHLQNSTDEGCMKETTTVNENKSKESPSPCPTCRSHTTSRKFRMDAVSGFVVAVVFLISFAISQLPA